MQLPFLQGWSTRSRVKVELYESEGYFKQAKYYNLPRLLNFAKFAYERFLSDLSSKMDYLTGY